MQPPCCTANRKVIAGNRNFLKVESKRGQGPRLVVVPSDGRIISSANSIVSNGWMRIVKNGLICGTISALAWREKP
jgi:hypothetical protein